MLTTIRRLIHSLSPTPPAAANRASSDNRDYAPRGGVRICPPVWPMREKSGCTAAFCFVRIHRESIETASARDAIRARCNRRSSANSTYRSDRTPAARARRSWDANRSAAARRGSERRRQTRPACPSDAAAHGGRCRLSTWRGSVMPRTLTCSRSTDESTYRAVPPPPASSPSTCHGSMACRNSISMLRCVTCAKNWEAEFEVRREPILLDREAGCLQFLEHFLKILRHEVRQHESIVQRRAPAHQRRSVRLVPEPGDQCPHQQLLRQAHPRVRRHFEAAELDQSQPARGTSRAKTACRCKTRRGACCRSRRPANCATPDRRSKEIARRSSATA